VIPLSSSSCSSPSASSSSSDTEEMITVRKPLKSEASSDRWRRAHQRRRDPMSSNAQRASSSRPPAPPRHHAAPPTLRESFLFPLATPEARRDLVTGGLTLLLPPRGWVLNMGHRLDVVHRIYHDAPSYYRGFRPWGRTALRGLKALTAILVYLSLGACCAALGYLQRSALLGGAGALLLLLAVYVLPGGMTLNAAHDDISYLYRPDRAARRALEGGRAYLWTTLNPPRPSPPACASM